MEGEAFPEGHVGLKGQDPVRVSRRSPTRIGHVVPAGVGLAKDLMVLALDGTLCRLWAGQPGSASVLHVRLSAGYGSVGGESHGCVDSTSGGADMWPRSRLVCDDTR